MTAARLTSVLGPFHTDADWSQDFLFYVGDSTTEQPWSGVQGAISFVRQGLPKARFTLSSAAGSLVVLGNGLGIRLPAAEMAKRVPGTYDFELRRIEPDGDTIALLVGQVVISAGLSAASPPVPGGGSSGGTGGTVLVTISNGAATTTLASVGPAGASAREAAIAAGALPGDATDAEFLAYLREPAVQASEALLAESEGARDTAVAARDVAVGAAGTATDAADTAISKAGEAGASATAAAGARDLALSYRDGAETARDLTLGYRDAAQAARDDAEDHRDSAQLYRDQSQAAAAAVATDKYSRVGSKLDAEGFEVPASVKAIATSGYHSAGDGGHALYKRVAAAPAHAGRLRSLDRYRPDGTIDAANGGWWEIADLELNARAFGAKGDGVTDDYAALQALLDAMIATGKPGFLPGGVFNTTQMLKIKASIGFNLRGAGTPRNHAGWPQYTSGTRIDFVGADPAEAIIRVEVGFTKNIALTDFGLKGKAAVATLSGDTTIYTLDVQNGIKFADTQFSCVNIDRMVFDSVQRCVGIYRVTFANGEYVQMSNCTGNNVGQAFFCDNNQSYRHSIRDSQFACFPNNAMIEMADGFVSGIGVQIINVSGGFYPTDAKAKSTLVKYQAGSTLSWIGGRIECGTRVLEHTRGTAADAGPITFDSVEMTILADAAPINLVDLLGNENTAPVRVEGCRFEVSGLPKRDLIVYVPNARGSVRFARCVFANVRNVITHRGTAYLGAIDFENCAIDGRPAGPGNAPMYTYSRRNGYDHDLGLSYGSANALLLSGFRQNYLLESAFGFSASVGNTQTNYTPPAPWVVTGNSGVFANAGRWPHGFTEQPYSSACFLEFASGQKVEQTLSGVTLSDSVLLRYRAHVAITLVSGSVSETQYLRFALVNDANQTIIYAEERLKISGGSRNMVVDLKRLFSGNDGTARLVIENLATGPVRVAMLWQHVTSRAGPVAFVSTTTTAVAGNKEWGGVPMTLAVLERFQPPLKDDAFGSTGNLSELQDGEFYVSRNDLRRVVYRDSQWMREPILHSASAQPSSGSWRAGTFVFNTSPSILGSKVLLGWSRLTTGSGHVSGTDWTPCFVATS